MKKRTYRFSDEAVQNATGKLWKEWFALLDKNKMNTRSHKEIASWIHTNFDISGWWSQNVTVEYEKEKGMREDYQKPSGYEVSVGKTFDKSNTRIYKYFTDRKLRKKWLKEEIEITTTTPDKSLRAIWEEDATRISVYFYPRSSAKCQVTVQHIKLADKATADKKKLFWAEKLITLKDLAKA
jgi:hypothetical protein